MNTPAFVSDSKLLSKLSNRAIGFLVVLALLLVWTILTTPFPGNSNAIVAPLRLPGPNLLWQSVCQLKWELVSYSITTFLRVSTGLLGGALIGVVVGLLMTRFRFVMAICDPIIEGLRPCPPIALIPFVILWFGLGTLGQIFVIALGCFMIMVVTTVNSVALIDTRLVRAAYSLGADSMTLYRTVIIYAITPQLVGALRIAAATGFALTVASEYLGAQGGLGYLIRNARQMLNTESILLAIIILGIESYMIDSIIRFFGKRTTIWLATDRKPLE